MMWAKRAAMSIVLVVGITGVAAGDQWNDRTTLKFDAPMLIPGATLAPGSYTFRLLDSQANRHVVQIFKQDSGQLMATTQAIPIKRQDARGDVVLKVNPTETGAPAAIKAWFYPGSLYGHQFVYPDAEAREIAQRTKTLVLSGDVRDSDMQKATLHTYDASGAKQPWRMDEGTRQEWDKWSRDRSAEATADSGERSDRSGTAATAQVAAPGTAETRESTAPAMRSQPTGTTVAIGDLEEHAEKYIGQTINVTGEVEEVFGPRLFKIDEPHWGDLDGEVLVYLPSDLAALVSEDDRVTVTGTMKMFMKADLERELGWLEPDPDVQIEFAERPILLASRIVGGNSNLALAIKVHKPEASGGADATKGATKNETANEQRTRDDNKAVATSGVSSTGDSKGMLTDAAALGRADREMVGRQIDLDRAKVTRMAKAHGFWIQAGNTNVFVLPSQYADGTMSPPAVGKTVALEGVVLEMPRSLRDKAGAADNSNEHVYVYATRVQ